MYSARFKGIEEFDSQGLKILFVSGGDGEFVNSGRGSDHRILS
jgi:hypothetical protein